MRVVERGRRAPVDACNAANLLSNGTEGFEEHAASSVGLVRRTRPDMWRP